MKSPEKGRQPSPIEHRPSARYLPIVRVVLLYVMFASLWILLSDKLAEQLFPRLDEFTHAQTYKGIAFVSASGALIFLLLKRELELRESAWEEYIRERDELLELIEKKAEELADAYDDTIEGWSRALELRDRDVRHHSARVTEVTLALARRMGISDGELVHIRRGALLHDIGKMGVPDRILFKRGPLGPEERVSMQRHTEFAINLLWEIEFLRPSLDIPAYHHERWNGTGYPHGLKGEEIPLAARIFAVVDVWDALTTDRPYRKALPREKALLYLHHQAGRLFDPGVVEVFIKMHQRGKTK